MLLFLIKLLQGRIQSLISIVNTQKEIIESKSKKDNISKLWEMIMNPFINKYNLETSQLNNLDGLYYTLGIFDNYISYVLFLNYILVHLSVKSAQEIILFDKNSSIQNNFNQETILLLNILKKVQKFYIKYN